MPGRSIVSFGDATRTRNAPTDREEPIHAKKESLGAIAPRDFVQQSVNLHPPNKRLKEISRKEPTTSEPRLF
jgi:hypothetical protein